MILLLQLLFYWPTHIYNSSLVLLKQSIPLLSWALVPLPLIPPSPTQRKRGSVPMPLSFYLLLFYNIVISLSLGCQPVTSLLLHIAAQQLSDVHALVFTWTSFSICAQHYQHDGKLIKNAALSYFIVLYVPRFGNSSAVWDCRQTTKAGQD